MRLPRFLKFGVAGILSVVGTEIVLGIGSLVMYGTFFIKGGLFSSVPIILLNVASLVVGTAIAFFANERVTVHGEGEQRKPGSWNLVARFLKFQALFAVVNIIIFSVQLGLLGFFAVPLVLGNLAGVAAAYPVSYTISMRNIWKVPLRNAPASPDGHER